MASSTWDGGSSLREDHIGIAARERLIELFASGDVLENTSFGGCANFVRNVLDRQPERWEEFLSRGVIDEFLHEMEIDNGLTCVPVVKRLTKEFPQTLGKQHLSDYNCVVTKKYLGKKRCGRPHTFGSAADPPPRRRGRAKGQTRGRGPWRSAGLAPRTT